MKKYYIKGVKKMKTDSKILILGSGGLLGSAIHRTLLIKGHTNILTPRSKELNLLEKDKIENYLKIEKPEYVFMIAGLVGGIQGNNKRPADFLYQNSIMILNVIEAIKNNCPKAKLLYPGSTCIYPKENPQPINEDRFMAGKLEETNKGYAVAKGVGVTACQLYRKQYGIDAISVMPTNLYGCNDNYDTENGHMLPGLIKKILLAKKNGNNQITLWGTGTPRREALYSEDCADAIIYLMNNYSSDQMINIGTGFDYSIKEIAEIIKNEIGWKGEIKWDLSKPDGTFEKRTDIQRLKKIYPEFNPITLKEGINKIINNKEQIDRILR
jgi:GDP-L-fucose synthase